jgi:hypothetical protein
MPQLLTPSSSPSLLPHRCRVAYEVGLGFIFRLPPVMVTFTKRRVYVILFLARPLGVFFFSCFSTCGHMSVSASGLLNFHSRDACGRSAGVASPGLPSHVPLFLHLIGVHRTLGVCDLTLPARAREPCTLPIVAVYAVMRVLVFVCGGFCEWRGSVSLDILSRTRQGRPKRRDSNAVDALKGGGDDLRSVRWARWSSSVSWCSNVPCRAPNFDSSAR